MAESKAKEATPVKEVKAATVKASPAKNKEVTFVPTASGTSTIAGVVYTYVSGKEIKLPESIAGILTQSKKGHKK